MPALNVIENAIEPFRLKIESTQPLFITPKLKNDINTGAINEIIKILDKTLRG